MEDERCCEGRRRIRNPVCRSPIQDRVLLLSSRETRRWVIPKGWPIRGLKPREVAAQEAFEEAGLVGAIVGERPIGSYHYSKQLSKHREMLCHVRVFLLSVDHQLDDWPEKAQREFRWVDPQTAAQMVQEGGLAEILRGAFPLIRRMEPKRPKLLRLHPKGHPHAP
jgi:8-oxo-dGTP pyrophosphatase MutT (NUDIX family)